MSDPLYDYVVIGMITGEHYVQDLHLRVPFRTPMPITAADYLNSKDLSRAIQQGYVKVIPQASIPAPAPTNVNVRGLEQKVDQLAWELRLSEQARQDEVKARQDLEGRLTEQKSTLDQILAAVQAIPQQTVVVQGQASPMPSVERKTEVVGGDVPMFIPENTPLGTDSRLTMDPTEKATDVGEAAQALRKLRKSQGKG